MALEPGQCPPMDWGCILPVSLTFGVGIGTIKSLLAIPVVMALTVAVVGHLARLTRNPWWCAIAAARTLLMNFAIAVAIAAVAAAFDVEGRIDIAEVVVALGFGPRAFESGRALVELFVAPLASLHFWLVAWDAWRWQRRKIAEHEAAKAAHE